jgi:hypothetical protein
MEDKIVGYPVEVLYVTAIIGLVLLIFRPRWAFFFIVFGLACRHFNMAVFTRSSFLGEFLNLNDLFVWIGILAMVRIGWQEERIWAPKILLAIIAILVIGDFHSLYNYSFDYGVIRVIWGSWIFPLTMLVAINMVRTSQDARNFYWALFFGALVAAVQHLIFLQEQSMLGNALFIEGGLRTIAYILSGGIFLVISAFFVDMRRMLQSSYLFIFWLMGLSLIAISYVLSFTRTIWVGALVAAGTLFLIFYQERRKLYSRLGYALILIVLIFLVFRVANIYVLKGVDVAESIDERADFIRYEDSFEDAYQTREKGMETELQLWKNSFILWGVGASYPPKLLDATIEESGALGHVAFSTYLAHFGLIGLIVYGLLLPFLTIRTGRRYYFQHQLDYGGALAVTAMALACFDVATLLSSNQYLTPIGQVQGLIYGALWGLARPLRVPAIVSSGERIRNPQLQQRRLPVLGNR